MITAGILATFFALLIFGVPIFIAFGAASTVAYLAHGETLAALAQKIVDQLNSSALMAIPFFVVAATFMQHGGVSQALVDAAHSWIRRVPGGLALVCVVATTIFAAICGSSTATALAMGAILIPAMLDRHYERRFAIGVVGASGTLGILIPPSLPLIVFAIITDESVPRLFLAGLVPGLIQAFLFAVYVLYYAKTRNYPVDPPISREEFIRTNIRALPAFSMPAIVLGGIYGGITTVTEAAALSAVVAAGLSLFYSRKLRARDLAPIIGESMKTAATIMMIIGVALVFGYWVTQLGIASWLVTKATDLNLTAWQFLLIVNLALLVLGMFLEVISLLLITVPLLQPLLHPLGIDPVHFAIILVINMELAVLTPPIGLNLYVLSSISNTSIAEVVRGTMPFIGLLLAFLLCVSYIPELSLFLPNLVFGAR